MKYICNITVWTLLWCCAFKTSAQDKIGTSDLVKSQSDTVSVAFGRIDADDAISTIYTVDPKKILEQDRILDIPNSLIGRVPGFFDVANLRGLGGSLWIVDGLPRDPRSLNMTMVDQISVLKDINSAVLYGNEAINGIVLITTKRGKIQKNQIHVSGHYGVSTPAELPRFLSSADYAKLYNEARVNDGLTALYYQSEIDGYASGEDPVMFPDVDYYSREYLKQLRPFSNVVAEFTGGNPIATYYTNLGWNRTGSYFDFGQGKNNKSDEFNLRANVDLKVNSFIKSALDASAVFRNTSGARSDYWSQAATLRPNLFQPLIPIERIEEGDSFMLGARNIIDGKYILGGTQQYLTNPIADMLSAGKNENVNNQFSFNNRIDVDLKKVTEGLSFRTNLSFDYVTYYNQYINNTYSVYQPRIIGDSVRIVNQFNKDSRTGEQYVSGQGFQRRVGYYGMLDYDRRFDGVHHVFGALTAMGNHRKDNGSVQEVKNANLGLRLAYIYDKRYGIDFSGVYQNSVKLHPDSRWALSPSLGLAWTLSNENFMSSLDAVNHLKLRVSAGILHTDHEIASFNYYKSPYVQSGGFGWYEGTISSTRVVSQYGGNPGLGFEKRKEVNIGLDGRFFDNMLSVNADVYFSSIYDRITRASTLFPSYYSDFTPYYNFNSEGYRGADFGIAFDKTINDFSVRFEVNALYQQTEVLERDEVYSESYLYRKGRPLDGLYGLESAGLFMDQNEIDNHFFQTYGTVKPGDIKYVDQNNDLLIDDNDMVYLGRQWPPFTYGLNITLRYKNLSLFAIGNGQQGAQAMLSGSYYWVDGNAKYSEVVLDRWTENTKHTATYPRLSSQANSNNHRNSSYWMYDNDTFLLQRVQLNYDFPEKLVTPLKMRALSVFVNGSNLLTISKYRKVRELVVGSDPFSRSFTVGLKVDFK